ncbi:binding-protein-dependent transport systems inner membrane component [Kribbella flavida DSM 17836]|uniref:Binding-protein-dependent transport systems inner membrane component n=1 Tax=Kribbella flavida (strain DSM 17836 / JCM 10339 / NBRC 14399) TaxID=479435 RepID=D2PR79_KRIFD|nr:ABC transporter permease [Kribbella flavida]ADB33027.1 binding-protein-dependent transport systems inner membrane component [Kribbella flavida DSM 17836]
MLNTTDAPEEAAIRPRGSGLAGAVVSRLVRLALLLVAVAVASFALMLGSPVDPVDAYVGADIAAIGPEQREQIAERWGLNDPPAERFGNWLSHVLRGDLGHSHTFNQPVTEVIAGKFLTSLALMAVAWCLSGVIGFGLGLIAGVQRGRLVDRVITWWAYVLASAPTFWVGLLLLYAFSVSLQWTPVCCAVPVGQVASEVGLLDRLHHLLLPAFTLSLVGIAPVVLHTRQAVSVAMASDYVAFARAQGERSTGLVIHRVLRNAAGPALLLQFSSLGELFGGSLLAEHVFSYPGLGAATTAAALGQDVPLLLGIALFTAVFVYTGNQLGDLLHGWLDPRTRRTEAAR